MRFLLIAVCLLLAPLSYGVLAHPGSVRFGECDADECSFRPDDGGPFPPDAVTGHTVFAEWILHTEVPFAGDTAARFPRVPADTLPPRPALPAAPPAVPDDHTPFGPEEHGEQILQAECVAWLNGMRIDARPTIDPLQWGDSNTHFSDEDQEPNEPGHPSGGGDAAYQDHDFDRSQNTCIPSYDTLDPELAWIGVPTDFAAVVGHYAHVTASGTHTAEYAVVVEAGDCDPAEGEKFRFRGHLDFVDPNNVYHEVQEYDYVCPMGGPQNVVPDLGQFGMDGASDLVAELFPWTYTDRHGERGCEMYETPLDNGDPSEGRIGHFDWGHKCNGTWQDLFTERLWITPLHQEVYDPTAYNVYNFALVVDTCSGVNGRDGLPVPVSGVTGPGDPTPGEPGPGDDAHEPYPLHDTLSRAWYDTGLAEYLGPYPTDVCTDGSSFSFDDTARGLVGHHGPPVGPGSGEMLRGNSYGFDPQGDTFTLHRSNCRHDDLEWRYNSLPDETWGTTDECYNEDHKAGMIDIYVFDADPTGGLFVLYTNGLTGPASAYVPGPISGPHYPEAS